MPLAFFPDLDGLDGLISQAETVLSIYLAACMLVIAFVAVGHGIARVKRRRGSPVEKQLRRRPF